MGKKVSRKQKTLLIMLGSGLILLVALLILLAAILINGNTDDDTLPTVPSAPVSGGVQDTSKVYWNLDKELYFGTDKNRSRDVDGYYSVRFAEDGKIYSYRTDDRALLERIDSLYVMGLTLTAGGEILDVHPVETYTGGLAVDWGYVSKVSGSTVSCSLSAGLRGENINLKLSGKTAVYDISTENVRRINPSDMEERGHVLAVIDQNGNATHVYYRPKYYNVYMDAACGCYGSDLTWNAWDGTGTLQDGGHYYLTKDIQAPAGGFKFSTGTYYIRLDGYKITGKDRVFHVQGDATLYVCDHTTRGVLAGKGISGEAGGTIRQEGADSAVYLINIDITAGSQLTAKTGGVIYTGGLCCLDNVSISGGKAASGGGIYVASSGHLQMRDCTIRAGQSTGKGGNLYLGGSAFLQNVRLIDGSASSGGSGIYLESTTAKRNILDNVELSFESTNTDGIYVSSGKLTLSGTVKLFGLKKGNLRLAGGKLRLEGLMSGSEIGITASGSGQFAENAEEEEVYCFVSDDRELLIVADAAGKTLSLSDRGSTNTHNYAHCICGGLGKLGSHEECVRLTDWTALNSSVLKKVGDYYQFAASGNYFLPNDFAPGVVIEIPFGQEVTLCLNGYKLTSSRRVFRVSGTLNICDCHGDDSAGRIVSSVGGGAAMDGYASGIINVFGGRLYAAGKDSCVINLKNTVGSANAGGKEGIGAVLNIYGGEIYGGNRASDNGGNIWATVNTVVNVYGGKISGGQAVNGGNIYSCGLLNIFGGEIVDGKSAAEESGTAEQPAAVVAGNGGNIYFAYSDTGVLRISGGKISGGQAVNGGNLYTEAPLNFTDGTITMGTAKQSGGNIYLTGTAGKTIAHTISGGSVLNGVADVSGGNIYMGVNTSLSGCTVAGGQAALGGGVMLERDVVMTIFGNPAINGNFTAKYNPLDPSKPITSRGNLYMALGSSLNVRMVGFGQSAKIGLDMEIPGVFATGLAADYSYAFFCDSELYPVVYDVRQRTLSLSDGIDRTNPESHNDHCICGGNAVGVGDHSACTQESWMPVFSASDLITAVKRGKNAYLSADIVLKNTFDLGEGVFYPITICLNGHTVSAETGVAMFVVRDVFNLTDCQKTADGQFKGALKGQNLAGAIFQIYNHTGQTAAGTAPTLNIFGGNLLPGYTGAAAADKGGLILLGVGNGVEFEKTAVLNLYAGTISGGSAKNGGNIYADGTCRIHIYGGKIAGGVAENGANLYLNHQAKAFLYGGEITGGNASVNGGGVFVSPDCSLVVSGGVKITGNSKGTEANNVYLPKGTSVQVGVLTQDALIGVTMEDPAVGAVVVTGAASDLSGCFVCENTANVLTFDEAVGKLVLEKPAWEINTAEDLELLRQHPEDDFILKGDINGGGATWIPVENFAGTLTGAEGKTFVISNFVIAVSGPDQIPTFFLNATGTITNVEFRDLLVPAPEPDPTPGPQVPGEPDTPPEPDPAPGPESSDTPDTSSEQGNAVG